MSIDYSCLFPTMLLAVGMHPRVEMEIELCWAYNRWLTEKALPEADGRLYSMLCLPLSDPDEALRQVETFGDRKHVTGFMVSSVRASRCTTTCNEGLSRDRGARAGARVPFRRQSVEPVFKSLNRFASVHALGFPIYNIMHMTNWVTNGLGERFPKLPVIWIEGGLAWVPFLMQRLDHEYMLRPSEYPLLKKKPSDYMRDMYYASQPMEREDMLALECTFRMINAETQLLYASDYPHWDFDLPSTSGTCRSCPRRPSTTSSAAPPRACSSCRRATRSRKRTSTLRQSRRVKSSRVPGAAQHEVMRRRPGTRFLPEQATGTPHLRCITACCTACGEHGGSGCVQSWDCACAGSLPASSRLTTPPTRKQISTKARRSR